ncbi:MAG: tRNA uridine-5-carboxymethylaminomethyl(34) synthesis GTPase MnmE [Rhodobacteraceae bacterium]|nr:tRNA uridine-5-carboxymethylaminomethyl(34) synthesis GTPase MnmE [Paracoccaceae bacterium]
MDTIFALASAAGKAGVAVIRISGADALVAGQKLAGPLPEHGRRLCRLRRGDGSLLDEALVLTFAQGRSFTGEIVVELQVHGSVAVIGALLRELGDMAGLRAAEAGEFTRRALENNVLDLAQVEGLADLIDAETEAQHRQSVRVLAGALGQRAAEWRADLIQVMALIEAVIDFADEEVPEELSPAVGKLIEKVAAALEQESLGVKAAERIRSGFEIAIVGAPNSGKSTLLNRLAGRSAAITSHIAGTTRDVIEVRMDMGGLAVTVLDTAGIREARDEIEIIGIELTMARAEAADIRVHLVGDNGKTELAVKAGDIVLRAKADTGPVGGVSGRTGFGVDELVDALTGELKSRTANVGIAMRERHRVAMVKAKSELDKALLLLPESTVAPELPAEHLRLAIRAIDSLVGKVDVEDVLGEIFSRFCIGK